MREVKDFTLQPGETKTLKPSDEHLMVLGLKQPLKEDENVDIKLCFGEFCTQSSFKVVGVLNENSQANYHHHH